MELSTRGMNSPVAALAVAIALSAAPLDWTATPAVAAVAAQVAFLSQEQKFNRYLFEGNQGKSRIA